MDRDDASISSAAGAGPTSAVAVAVATTTTTTASSAASAATIGVVAPTALSRSVSQQSATSSRSHRSRRTTSQRGSSRVRMGLPGLPGLAGLAGLSGLPGLPGLPAGPSGQAGSTTSSGSASIISDDNKSLTSFPSFSPELPPFPLSSANRPRHLAGVASSNTSIVDSLLSSGLPPPPMVSASAPTISSIAFASASGSSSHSSSSVAAARSALFDDTPPLPSSRVLPGSLHLTDDAHLARLIGKHGAVALVRQLAEDLAARDAQVTALRARAADRERFLRKLLQDCAGLSSLEVETRLRAMEQEQEARLLSQSQAAASDTQHTSRPASLASHRVSDLVSDAMADDNSLGLYQARDGRTGDGYFDPFAPYGTATIRAASRSTSASRATTTSASNTGTTKGWKDYLWGGGTTKKASQAGSINGDSASVSSQQQQQQNGQSTVVRARLPPGSDRRTVLADDVFRPPLSTAAEGEVAGNAPARKPSLASMALRLVGAGGNSNNNSASNKTTTEAPTTVLSPVRSSRAATLQGGGAPPKVGPRALMTMRRTASALSVRGGVSTPQHIPGARVGGNSTGGSGAIRNQMPERWGEMNEASPGGTGTNGFARPETYGPVEMDTILPLEVQPPTLTHMYHRYNSEGYLIDRFGFIYDQRRKRRQREAAQMAGHMKRRSRHSETLSMGRSGRSTPASLRLHGEDDVDNEEDDDDYVSKKNVDIANVVETGVDGGVDESGRANSPTAALDEALLRDGADDKDPKNGREAPAKRWQDYLKIATFPTELLSHTPAMSDTHVQVITDDDDDDDGASGSTASELGPKSPRLMTADGRGFAPSTTTTTTSTTTTETNQVTAVSGQMLTVPTTAQQQQQRRQQQEESERKAATLVMEDVEPVRLLLQQLSELHDALQKERTVRWNEFMRKVRAERRRESEAAAATAAAVAESRFLRPTAVMPETRLADGEMVGVAGLGNKGKLGRAKWNEFRALVLGGIPVALRAKIWAECTGATSLRVPGEYEALELGEDVAGVDGDILVQIQADIHRTLTDNIFFRTGPGATKLRAVLLAYARRNPEVGYCQGMNLIAANLLLVTPSAADAFWLLASIVETILPAGYYDHSLAASRADQQVLRGFVAEVLPRLSGHLDALAIDLETMTFPWFLSVFTDCLSAEALFRVWDVVFCLGDGSAFLFSVALALLKLNEAALLRCDTPAAVYTYINHQMTNHAISIDGLVQASEALRRLVRRDDVDARRARAMAADRVLVAERAAALEVVQAARRARAAAIEAEARENVLGEIADGMETAGTVAVDS